MILKELPGNISLQRLTQKLELDYKEINTIYDNKVLEYKENVKFYHLTKKLQDKELTIHSGKFFTQVVSTLNFTHFLFLFREWDRKQQLRMKSVTSARNLFTPLAVTSKSQLHSSTADMPII
jgi:hypothetical protein